jgi:hypothetical protein
MSELVPPSDDSARAPHSSGGEHVPNGFKQHVIYGTFTHLISMAIGGGLVSLGGLIWTFLKGWDTWTVVIIGTYFLSAVGVVSALIYVRAKHRKHVEVVINRYEERLRVLAAEKATAIARLNEVHSLQLTTVTKVQHGDFEKRTEAHHSFVHAARDALVKCYPAQLQKGPRTTGLYQGIKRRAPAELETMLQGLTETFRPLVPEGTRLFASIRERTGAEEYETKARYGDCDHKARADGTKALHRQNKMLAELDKSFWKGQCVILTGSAEPNWQEQPNDHLGEDKAVMMGAIFSKQLRPRKMRPEDSEWQPMHLEWIVCLAADKAGVFNNTHLPLMKCFNDVFGILLNVIIRFPIGGGNGSQPLEARPPDGHQPPPNLPGLEE